MNLASMLVRSARAFPDLPAIGVGRKVVMTYAEMASLVEDWAGALSRSFALGERIAIVAENNQHYLPALFAIWHAGMVAVPVNAKLHAREVAYVLEHSGARYVFGNGSPMTGLERRPPVSIVPRSNADPAWIFYTSGTTGRPKGAVLTHGNLWAMVASFLADVEAVEPGDAMVHACQLSHGSGLYALPHVYKAACNVVLESGGFDAAETDKLLSHWTESCTFGPPTVLNRVVAARHDPIFRTNNDSLKSLIFGGSPLYVEDLWRAWDVTDGRVTQIYGQGESPCTITSIQRAGYREMFARHDKQRLASVGQAQFGVELMVADQEDRALPAGEVGEVLVRGPMVMSGYLDNPEATAAALRNGWLHTGDVGFLDDDGFLTLKDRSKDVIISGGFNVYPREVEEVLLKHPAVLECSVIGVKSEQWGEEVTAYAVTDTRAMMDDVLRSELDALCLANIARFKRPRAYHFVSELPKGLTGKVQKSALREMTDA